MKPGVPQMPWAGVLRDSARSKSASLATWSFVRNTLAPFKSLWTTGGFLLCSACRASAVALATLHCRGRSTCLAYQSETSPPSATSSRITGWRWWGSTASTRSTFLWEMDCWSEAARSMSSISSGGVPGRGYFPTIRRPSYSSNHATLIPPRPNTFTRVALVSSKFTMLGAMDSDTTACAGIRLLMIWGDTFGFGLPAFCRIICRYLESGLAASYRMKTNCGNVATGLLPTCLLQSCWMSSVGGKGCIRSVSQRSSPSRGRPSAVPNSRKLLSMRSS
mmetsp:Transcript_14481/g.25668  ORF Transcript_14481/g.25668 Transcript_14481/m.25668 type:complete len:277 (-) Transcript_14481:3062-3892(-)